MYLFLASCEKLQYSHLGSTRAEYFGERDKYSEILIEKRIEVELHKMQLVSCSRISNIQFLLSIDPMDISNTKG